jgi:hypothetical protein
VLEGRPPCPLIPRGRRPHFATILDTCARSPDLPFRHVLTEEQIEPFAAEEGASFGDGPGCIYSVALTLEAFLAHLLSKDKSCMADVTRVVVLLVALARVSASEYGFPAPGYAEACRLLKV